MIKRFSIYLYTIKKVMEDEASILSNDGKVNEVKIVQTFL